MRAVLGILMLYLGVVLVIVGAVKLNALALVAPIPPDPAGGLYILGGVLAVALSFIFGTQRSDDS